MTCNITSTPFYPEPLPLYPGRRDPDTASILSSAPSYHSDAPTYTSRRTSTGQQPTSLLNIGSTNRSSNRNSVTIGLPNLRYAPGYESRAHGSMMDIQSHNYNIANWSSIHSSNSRQYQRVAARRVNAAAGSFASISALASVAPPSTPSPTATSASHGGSSVAVATIVEANSPMASSTDLAIITAESTETSSSSSSSSPSPYNDMISAADPQPVHPREDPALVGEFAAARAREQRLYREMALRDDSMALRADGKAWDFMISQMADWEQRTESWHKFRSNVNARGAVSGIAGKMKTGLGIGGGRKLLKRGRLLG